MPTLANTQQLYFDKLRTLVVNPGQRFISLADEELAINSAALFVASKLGGIFYVDNTLLTVAGQFDYVMPNQIFDIRHMELVTPGVTPNAETVEYVDVVPYETFRQIQAGGNSTARFAYFIPETTQLHIEPAPTVDGLQIRLLCFGFPNQLTRSITLYDGNIEQVNAVAFEAAAQLREKTRDDVTAERLHNRALEYIESAAQTNSSRRSVKRIQIGQNTPPTHMRRF